MEYIIIACVIGVIPAFIASSKGRNFFLWWIYGACLFVVALIHSLVISKDMKPKQSSARRVTIEPRRTPTAVLGATILYIKKDPACAGFTSIRRLT